MKVGTTRALQELSHQHVKYKVAGAAMRNVLLRANRIRPPLGARERAVLEAVLDRTASYSKLHDVTTTRQLAAIAYGVSIDEVHGHQRKRTREVLERLAQRGLVEMTPCGRGRSARLVVSITNEKTPLVRVFDGEDESSMTPVGARNEPYESLEMTPVSAAHLEDLGDDLEDFKGGLEEEVGSNEDVDTSEWRTHASGFACDRCEGLKKPCTSCKVEIAMAHTRTMAMAVA